MEAKTAEGCWNRYGVGVDIHSRFGAWCVIDPAESNGAAAKPEATNPGASSALDYWERRDPYRINLEQSVELGLVNSREFQSRREDLYLTALPVTLERFAFSAQFFATEQAIRERSGRLTPEGQHNRWRLGTDTGFTKTFSTGALLLFRLANQTVAELTGDFPKHTIDPKVRVIQLQLAELGAFRRQAGFRFLDQVLRGGHLFRAGLAGLLHQPLPPLQLVAGRRYLTFERLDRCLLLGDAQLLLLRQLECQLDLLPGVRQRCLCLLDLLLGDGLIHLHEHHSRRDGVVLVDGDRDDQAGLDGVQRRHSTLDIDIAGDHQAQVGRCGRCLGILVSPGHGEQPAGAGHTCRQEDQAKNPGDAPGAVNSFHGTVLNIRRRTGSGADRRPSSRCMT